MRADTSIRSHATVSMAASTVRASTTEPFRPTEIQRELLAVAFEEPAAATRAWTALQRRLDLDTLEPGVFALLPLAYRSATRGGLAGGVLERLKGIVRKTWVVNNLLLRRSAEVANALRDAGIRALFAEGPVFASRFYPELGLRPSPYIDVLVDTGTVGAAGEPLYALGWYPDPTDAAPRDDRRYLVNGDGQRCLVRTSVAVDFNGLHGRRAAHAPLWDAAEPVEVGGVELLGLSRTDSLLAVCVAHARSGSPSGPQWIADAKMLLEGPVDWPRLTNLAAGGGQVLRFARALSCVAEIAGPRPPAELLASLVDTDVSRRERLIYDCTTGRFRRLGNLPWLVAEHLSETAGTSIARAATSFPSHLRDQWGLAHTWQLPAAAGGRVVSRLTRGAHPSGRAS